MGIREYFPIPARARSGRGGDSVGYRLWGSHLETHPARRDYPWIQQFRTKRSKWPRRGRSQRMCTNRNIGARQVNAQNRAARSMSCCSVQAPNSRDSREGWAGADG